ncbi:deoxyribose-phosphate aldolase [soil metagenome]
MIAKLCEEAGTFRFAAVCVPPCYVRQAKDLLQDSGVKVVTVIGFPLGYQQTDVKFFEAHKALMQGADELDVVMNLAAFKSGHYEEVESELGQLATLCDIKQALLKVIIETGLLSPQEIIAACGICADAGAAFVKTSTGFSSRGASVADVQLMRRHLPPAMQIKASGGIKTLEEAKALIEAGADRIGCSASIQLIQNGYKV